MLRPSFSVVTLTLVALAGFGVLVEAIRPRIPLPPPNALKGSGEAFLEQAAHQPIDWMRWGPGVFPRARRESRPVLMVIGTAWSTLGRWVDGNFFSDPEMGRYVARTFVCVRVDGQENPAFLNAFGPFSRIRESRASAFQLVVLTSSGEVVATISRTGAVAAVDRNVLMATLVRAKRAADDGVLDSGHLEDRALLDRPLPSTIDLPMNYARGVERSIDNGGHVLIGGWRPFAPTVWNFLALAGRDAALGRSIEGAVRSPAYDPLDGGFFRGMIFTPSGARTELDFVAVKNAEAAVALARVRRDSVGSIDPGQLARRTARFALGGFGTDRIYAAQIGTVDARGRSPRHSFPPAMLRRSLSGEERERAERWFGMDVRTNPQCLPYPRSIPIAQLGEAERLLERFRELRDWPPTLVNNGLVGVEGRVVARGLEAARLLGDRELGEIALNRADRLTDFRRDGRWIAREPDDGTDLDLRDRLAIADAELRTFLLAGRADAYLDGRDVLDEVLALHELAPGIHTIPERASIQQDWLSAPGLADTDGESTSATLVRLLTEYAAAEGNTERARRYRRVADEILRRLAPEALGDISLLGGFYAAEWLAKDPTVAVVVGRDAVGEANRLAALAPRRIVLPSAGPCRPEFRRRPAGVYLVSGPTVDGPLTMEIAESRLNARR